MTATCIYCGQMFSEVPIIGEPDKSFAEFYDTLGKHIFNNHQKQHVKVLQEALKKIAVITLELTRLGCLTQFHPDAELHAKKLAQYANAENLLADFKPEPLNIASKS